MCVQKLINKEQVACKHDKDALAQVQASVYSAADSRTRQKALANSQVDEVNSGKNVSPGKGDVNSC